MKDVLALNRCSACGHTKRAHLLCPYCVRGKIKMYVMVLFIPTNLFIEIHRFITGKTLNKEKRTKDEPEDGKEK